jgi:hypothetical protein
MLSAVGTMRCGLSKTLRLAYLRLKSDNISRVPSFDIPSTTITSIPPGTESAVKIDRKHRSMKRASFRAGMMTVSSGDESITEKISGVVDYYVCVANGSRNNFDPTILSQESRYNDVTKNCSSIYPLKWPFRSLVNSIASLAQRLPETRNGNTIFTGVYR